MLAWGSFALGIASAALMDRRPERAWLVVLAIVVGWAGCIVFAVLDRGEHRPTLLWRLVRLGSRLAALSPVQFALFFTLPFYARAYAGLVGHALFLAILAFAAVITLWDPWHEALAKRPLSSTLLQAIATFAGINAVLPLLGVPNGQSLWVAAFATFIIVPLSTWFSLPVPERRPFVRRLTPYLLVSLLLITLPPARRMIPAAPLRLMGAKIGTSIQGYDVAGANDTLEHPTELACSTSVWAPRGLRDALVHVWKKDGVVVDEIAVQVRGGRDAGFRTFSLKKNLGPSPAGVWRCAVETTFGQSLGEYEVVVR